MRYCDNCKREPEAFDVGESTEKGYFFVVPKGDPDPAHLMSDMSLKFCICTDYNPSDSPDMEFWCVKCIDAMGGELF